MPVTVAHLGGAARRVHDVGEQHRGQHPIIGHVGLLAGEELGDLLEGLAPWLDVVIHVAPWQLNVFRVRECGLRCTCPTRAGRRVVRVVDDQSGHANCRKHRSHVH